MATLSSSGAAALPATSYSWRKNGRTDREIKPFATVDLHGKTKEQAIRTVTDFFETSARQAKSSNPWVMVITGTGAHSGALGGPILKQAVHKLLNKREMEYCFIKKMGVFKVNVLSGHVLKSNPTAQELHVAGTTAVSSCGQFRDGAVLEEPLGQDTKVKLMRRPGSSATTPTPAVLRPVHKKKVVGKKIRKDLQTYNNNTAATRPKPQQQRAINSSSPRPSELAADAKMIEKAKSLSLQDTRRNQSQRDKEQHQLQKILKQSQQEAVDEQGREQEELRRAMALSQQEPTNDAEEEELERILQLSLQESQQQPPQSATSASPDNYYDEEDEELQRILAQSKLNHSQHQQEEQEEDEELRRVLQLSMYDASAKEEANDNNDTEEEEALQRVLRLSMVEASGGMPLELTNILAGADNDSAGDASREEFHPQPSNDFNLGVAEIEEEFEAANVNDPSDLASENIIAVDHNGFGASAEEAGFQSSEGSANDQFNVLPEAPETPQMLESPSFEGPGQQEHVLPSMSVSSQGNQMFLSLPTPSPTDPKAVSEHDRPTFILEPEQAPTASAPAPNESDDNTDSLLSGTSLNPAQDKVISFSGTPNQLPIGRFAPQDSADQHQSRPSPTLHGMQRPCQVAPQQLQTQPTVPPTPSMGEVLLESILYNNNKSTHQSPATINQSAPAQQAQPVLPQAVIEHRMMELLQRPIVPLSAQPSINPHENLQVPQNQGYSQMAAPTGPTPAPGGSGVDILAILQRPIHAPQGGHGGAS